MYLSFPTCPVPNGPAILVSVSPPGFTTRFTSPGPVPARTTTGAERAVSTSKPQLANFREL